MSYTVELFNELHLLILLVAGSTSPIVWKYMSCDWSVN